MQVGLHHLKDHKTFISKEYLTLKDILNKHPRFWKTKTLLLRFFFPQLHRVIYVQLHVGDIGAFSCYCFITSATYWLTQVKWFTTVIRFEPKVLPDGRLRLSNHLHICMRSETRLLDGELTWLLAVFHIACICAQMHAM